MLDTVNPTFEFWSNTPPYLTTGRTFSTIDHLLPCLRSPSTNTIIRGWCFDHLIKIRELSVLFNTGDLSPPMQVRALYPTQRLDVLQAFPHLSNSLLSGFLVSIPVPIEDIRDKIHVSYRLNAWETASFPLAIPSPFSQELLEAGLVSILKSRYASIGILGAWEVKERLDTVLTDPKVGLLIIAKGILPEHVMEIKLPHVVCDQSEAELIIRRISHPALLVHELSENRNEFSNNLLALARTLPNQTLLSRLTTGEP